MPIWDLGLKITEDQVLFDSDSYQNATRIQREANQKATIIQPESNQNQTRNQQESNQNPTRITATYFMWSKPNFQKIQIQFVFDSKPD